MAALLGHPGNRPSSEEGGDESASREVPEEDFVEGFRILSNGWEPPDNVAAIEARIPCRGFGSLG